MDSVPIKRTPFLRTCCHALVVLLLLQTTACTYYKEESLSPRQLANLQLIGEMKKRFIVHWMATDLEMVDIGLTEDHLVGRLAPIEEPFVYPTPRRNEKVKIDEMDIFREVHIYLSPTTDPISPGPSAIPVHDILEIKIIEEDKAESTITAVGTTIGIAAAIFLTIGIIALATKSSCPYVYTHDGQGYAFAGEIFGGAIVRNLERDDYLPLAEARPINGTYRLRLSNELRERQYTDLAQLLLVEHDQDQHALVDAKGNPYLYSDPLPANRALSPDGQPLDSLLGNKDGRAFAFNELEADGKALSLRFSPPSDTRSVALLLRARNTLWVDYIAGEMMSRLGAYFSQWQWFQSLKSAGHLWPAMVDMQLPLRISLWDGAQWVQVEDIPPVGPLQYRDLIIPLGRKWPKGKDVRVRLETGFMFWEVDYARLALSPEPPKTVHRVKPLRAFSKDNPDEAALLADADNRYLMQSKIGEVTEIHYPAPNPPPGRVTSAFLHARGYYEWIRDYSGFPDFRELARFQEPGRLSEFSRQAYLKHLERIPLPAALQ